MFKTMINVIEEASEEDKKCVPLAAVFLKSYFQDLSADTDTICCECALCIRLFYIFIEYPTFFDFCIIKYIFNDRWYHFQSPISSTQPICSVSTVFISMS